MAKDFGRTDFWAPDSGLDSVAPGVDYTLADGSVLNIQENDWVDVDATGLPEDTFWGSSHQVISVSGDSISVKAYNADADLFEPQEVSIQWVMNNYRRVPNG